MKKSAAHLPRSGGILRRVYFLNGKLVILLSPIYTFIYSMPLVFGVLFNTVSRPKIIQELSTIVILIFAVIWLKFFPNDDIKRSIKYDNNRLNSLISAKNYGCYFYWR